MKTRPTLPFNLVVLGLCALAAVRVLLACLAFPGYNNVDEMSHLDLVVRYAKGDPPASCLPPFDEETKRLVATYGSPEFLFPPSRYPGGGIPPPSWRRPPADEAGMIASRIEAMGAYTNKEACSPPVYYAAAAIWLDAGRALGVGKGSLTAWTRMLNVPNIVFLVLLAHAFARRFFPGDLVLAIGAPALVAAWPQDTFFSINSDVLSPSLFALALYLVLRLALDERERGAALAAAAGLAASAAMLTKLSNWVIAPLIVVVLVVAKRAGRRAAKRVEGRAGRRAGLPIALLVLCTLGPVAAWIARNLAAVGDALGTREKIAALGWTVNPLLSRLNNIVFTPRGAADLLWGTIATFWRGEFVWHGAPLTWTALDAALVLTSLVFVAAALVPVIGRTRRSRLLPARDLTDAPRSRDRSDVGGPGRDASDRDRDPVRWIFALTIALFGLFLLWASIRFDYGACLYPSRDRPYLRSGRLALGALVPFALLYVDGMRSVLAKLGAARLALPFVLALAGGLVVAEALLTAPVFASAYNWFHMP